MKPILTIILLLLALQCTAQSDTLRRRKAPAELPRKYIAIKLAGPNLHDPLNPNITLAVEKRFNIKNAVQLQAGTSLPIKTTVDRETVVARGIKLRAEYRRYWPKLKNNRDWFYGVEIFYTAYRSGHSEYFKDTTLPTGSYVDEYIVDKKMAGAALKLGFQHRLGKHILVELYFGPGFKYRDVIQTKRIDPDARPDKIHPDLFNNSNSPASEMSFSLPANFLVGYFFH